MQLSGRALTSGFSPQYFPGRGEELGKSERKCTQESKQARMKRSPHLDWIFETHIMKDVNQFPHVIL